MTIGHLLKLFGAALIYLVVNVLVSIIWVAIYAHLLNPGHPDGYYQEYAKISSPYSSIIAGMPLMFAMCYLLSGSWTTEFAIKSVVIIWIFYVLIDLGILFASGMNRRLALFAAISLITKLLAALLGAKLGAGAS